MSDFFEVLKAKRKRKDYLSRKYKKTFIHHTETGFKGTTGKYANRLMNQKFAELGINPKDLTKEQKEDYRKKLENDILNMPHNFGLEVIDKPPKEEAPLNYVSHADGFKGSIGQRAFRMIQDGIKGGMDIPEHQKEALRQNLVLDMQQNPEKHGLTEIVGAKRSDFRKPKSKKTPQAASTPPKIAPILPKETQQSTPDGLNMQKVMQAMKLLQDNNLPVTAESIEALLPHLSEQDSSPVQSRSNQSGNPYPTGLTPEGKFQPQRLATSFRGAEVETPAQKEKMLEYFRNNPDKRVQHRREGDESEQFLASLMNNMSAESDAETDFTQYFPSRYDEGGLAGADTRSATDDMDRPEIPDDLDPKKNKKRIENIERQQKIYDTKSGMTEEQLNQERIKTMAALEAKRVADNVAREKAMAGETKSAGGMTMDDWMNRLQISAANPTGAPPPTLNSNFDNNNMFDENGNLKEEYR